MRHKVCAGAALLALAATPLATAETYNFEVGLGFDRTQFDSSSVQTVDQPMPPTPITFTDDTSIDTDDIRLFGNWYFAGLSDDNGPRARAVFVDRASVATLAYLRSDQTFSTRFDNDSGLPFLPPGEFSSDQTLDSLSASVRLVDRNSGWYGLAGISRSDAEIEFNAPGLGGSEFDATGYSLGFGKYLFATTSLEIAVDWIEVDSNDATDISVDFTHLGSIGESWQYAVDLGYTNTDGDFGGDSDSYLAGLSLYPDRDLEFGIALTKEDGPFGGELTSIGIFGSWFFTPNASVGVRYRFDDVDSGFTAIGPLDSVDENQDAWGIGVNVRF